MTTYIEKARALANEVLSSEESKDYADAAAAAEENPSDTDKMAEFLRCKAEYEELVGSIFNTMQMALGVELTKKKCCSSGGAGCCKGRK